MIYNIIIFSIDKVKHVYYIYVNICVYIYVIPNLLRHKRLEYLDFTIIICSCCFCLIP